ncbi:uncharacterized protein LOC128394849 [Panonychus citri]|uniref:uncharacterized protein LOC128394849 n=1 Tax=Panonychus citri TaxID=50023 RepID=UPI0023080268|nr:uncharacterized protein LOC128394849 [Panonychus citri]
MARAPPKILLISLDGTDYVGSILNIATILHSRGNDVYVTNRRKHQFAAEAIGLKFIAFEEIDPNYGELIGDVVIPCMTRSMTKVNMPPLERLNSWSGEDTQILVALLRELVVIDRLLRSLAVDLKPDLIIGDTIYPPAFFMEDRIPCIPVYSVNPLGLYVKYGLLSGTGFSVHGDRSLWEKYREKEKVINERICGHFNEWYSNFGFQVTDMNLHRTFAKHFGIYIYPEVLDYTDLGPTPTNWVRLDPIMRKSSGRRFRMPEKLAKKPGALIYLCIGTATRVHVAIMNRLINTFGKSKHRFIVYKGPYGSQLTLPDNMWGKNDLDEVAVMSAVDLIISHGHNEMIYEGLYFGKPMMLMPLFFNQLDNAQRFVDLNLGVRVNPFVYDEAEIQVKVDNLLQDVDLHARIKKFSRKLKSTQNHHKVAEMIEQVARTGISPV